MRRPTILLADDHSIVAQSLARLLKDSFDVVEIVRDGAAMVEAALRLVPDVIVCDMSMPTMGGMEALRRLKISRPDFRLIFLTQHSEPALAAEAIRAGACGYVLKEASGEELINAIQTVLDGRVYLSSQIDAAVQKELASPQSKSGRLTPRQREVLQLIVAGKQMKEIAAALRLSRRTVEGHKYDMMEHLGIDSTAGLVRYAVQHGLTGE